MQRYTVYFIWKTALRVSGGTTTHHQERKQLSSTASGICHTVAAICRYIPHKSLSNVNYLLWHEHTTDLTFMGPCIVIIF